MATPAVHVFDGYRPPPTFRRRSRQAATPVPIDRHRVVLLFGRGAGIAWRLGDLAFPPFDGTLHGVKGRRLVLVTLKLMCFGHRGWRRRLLFHGPRRSVPFLHARSIGLQCSSGRPYAFGSPGFHSGLRTLWTCPQSSQRKCTTYGAHDATTIGR